jgi:serine/threonine protein kinase
MLGTRDVDHRADIYSLGVVFYELLTGELPLGRFSPPSQKVQIDVRLDEVVLRALEQKPEQRFQHVSEVKTRVEAISRSDSPEAGQPAKPSGNLSRWTARWRAMPAFVRQGAQIVLALAYMFGVIWVFSYSAGKENTAEGARTWMKVGQPSPWMEMESHPLGFNWRFHILTWAVPIAIVSLLLLAAARRLEEIDKGRAHSMWWHYAMWIVMFSVVLVTGLLQQFLSTTRPD